jgi:hypothetical protein
MAACSAACAAVIALLYVARAALISAAFVFDFTAVDAVAIAASRAVVAAVAATL